MADSLLVSSTIMFDGRTNVRDLMAGFKTRCNRVDGYCLVRHDGDEMGSGKRWGG